MNLFDVIALFEDLPAEGLKRGQVGMIVEKWTPGRYEVEIANADGVTCAMAALPAGKSIALCRHPDWSRQVA